MATNAQTGAVPGQLNRFIEAFATCHQGRRGYDSLLVGAQNTAIHPGCEAKIVSVYDEPAHPPSLAGATVAALFTESGNSAGQRVFIYLEDLPDYDYDIGSYS
jgi:hypothetical protein